MAQEKKTVFVVEGADLTLRIEAKEVPAARKLSKGEFATFGEARTAAVALLTVEIDKLRVVRQGIWGLAAGDVLSGKGRTKQAKVAKVFERRIA